MREKLRQFVMSRNGYWTIAMMVFWPLVIGFRIGILWAAQYGEAAILLFGLPTLLGFYLVAVIFERIGR